MKRFKAFSHLDNLTKISFNQSKRLLVFSSCDALASLSVFSLGGIGNLLLENSFIFFISIPLFNISFTSWSILTNSSVSLGNSFLISSEPINKLSRKVHVFWVSLKATHTSFISFKYFLHSTISFSKCALYLFLIIVCNCCIFSSNIAYWSSSIFNNLIPGTRS